MLDRANRLGADPAVTNYGGGNTSCKVEVTHAATGEATTLLYVKGSGGDLGTLRYQGLAALELDRLRGLDARYRGQAHEDEMVDLFGWCAYGPGGRRRRSTPPCMAWSGGPTSTTSTPTA